MIFAPAVTISGDLEIAVNVKVSDAETGHAIRDATVRVVEPYADGRHPPTKAASREDGTVRLPHRFEIIGERRAYRTTGEVRYRDRWLEVSAAGYRPSISPLTRQTGETGNLTQPTPRPILVALRRGEAPTQALGGIAGLHADGNGFESEALEIAADGRFWYTYSCCTGDSREYGYACLKEGRLLLAPVKHGEKADPALQIKYLPIRWGERVYLLPDDESIKRFCNAINHGWEPVQPGSRHVRFWLRRGDEKKPAPGLPELPERWQRYLLTKPIKGKIVEVLGTRTARLDLGSKDGVWQGMELGTFGTDGEEPCEVAVVSAGDRTCVIRITSYPGPDRFARGLTLGTRVTSRIADFE
jgi:hypothetical protein